MDSKNCLNVPKNSQHYNCRNIYHKHHIKKSLKTWKTAWALQAIYFILFVTLQLLFPELHNPYKSIH